MPRFCANISMLFADRPLLDRFAAAAAGFEAVEIQFPYESTAAEVAKAREAAGVEVILINIPAGDWAGGERGIAALPGREREFRDGVTRCLDYAQWLGCRRVNVLAGIPGNAPAAEADQVLVQNLDHAAEAMAPNGIRVMVEAVNSHDVAGFHIDTTEKALAAIDRAGHENLSLQYDIFHMVRMGRDAAAEIEANIARIGHIQFADVPGRHEPGSGEIDFVDLFRRIDKAGYAGWCGAEYIPAGATEDGLDWLTRFA